MSFGADDVASIVCSLGSHTCSAGFGGDDTPKCVFPSRIGRSGTQESETRSANSNTKSYVGVQNFTLPHDHMEVVRPIVHGEIVDWDACEAMWQYAFTDRLRIDPSEHPILQSEPPSVSASQRERMCEYMFEKFDAPAFFVVKDAVLSCFANAKQTAIVVDIGGDGTKITPVFDGYALLQSSIYSKLGGHRLSEELLKQLSSKQEIHPQYKIATKFSSKSSAKSKVNLKTFPNVTSSYHNEMLLRVADDAKHSICQVSHEPWNSQNNESLPPLEYELPDGHKIEIGSERFSIPELLFDPSPLNDNFFGLQNLIRSSTSKCDVDIRRDLYSSIVLTGSSSQFLGLNKRLENELVEILPSAMFKIKILHNAFSVEKKFAPWIGGSILASLGTFQQMWISKSEYSENGARIVETKCP